MIIDLFIRSVAPRAHLRETKLKNSIAATSITGMFHGSSGCFVKAHQIMEGSYCRIGWLEAGRDLLEVSTMTQISEIGLASLCGVTPRRVLPRFIKSTCIPPRQTLTSRVALFSHRHPFRGLYHYRFTQMPTALFTGLCENNAASR